MNELTAALTAAAIATGAAGNAIGKSRASGSKPLNKILGPTGALLGPLIMRRVLNIEMTDQEMVAVAVAASGLYSWVKNAAQFIGSIFKKEK